MERVLDRAFTQETEDQVVDRAREFERQVEVRVEQLFVLTTELQYLLELHAKERELLRRRSQIGLVLPGGGLGKGPVGIDQDIGKLAVDQLLV